MSQFTCYLVEKGADGRITAGLSKRDQADLPDDEVLIRVELSSLNYKDGLAATGQPGVARKFPHVPGIDAAGEVVESRAPDFRPGQKVLVTGYDMGAGRWGGWSEFARVPAEWVIPLPEGLSLLDAMRLGTAGFTAGLSVDALIRHEVSPKSGEVVVTGATGGVGCLAVCILARLGYSVAAVTGKSDRRKWLENLVRSVHSPQRGRRQRRQSAAEGGLGRNGRHGWRKHVGDAPLSRPGHRRRSTRASPSTRSATRHPAALHRHAAGPKGRPGAARAATWSGATSPTTAQMRWLEEDGHVSVFRAVRLQQRQHLRLRGPAALLRARPAPRVPLRARRHRHRHRRQVQRQAAQRAERHRRASRRRHLVHRPGLRHPGQLRRPQGQAGD